MIRLSSIRFSKQWALSMALTIVFLVAASASVHADPLSIETGLISGTAIGEDKAVHVYKGIPYAAPPVGRDLKDDEGPDSCNILPALLNQPHDISQST